MFGKRRAALASFLLCAFIFEFMGPCLTLGASDFEGGDAVIVLAGDPKGFRLSHAIELVKESDVRPLVVFLTPLNDTDHPRDRILLFLEERRVFRKDVRTVESLDSTIEEAVYVSALAKKCGWDKVAVVTSPYHSLRAGLLLRGKMADGIVVRVIRNKEPFEPWVWWLRSQDRDLVLSEYAKLVSSVRLLWEDPAVDAGLRC